MTLKQREEDNRRKREWWTSERYDDRRNISRQREEALKEARGTAYPVMKASLLETDAKISAPPNTNAPPANALSIIVCGRYSWTKPEGAKDLEEGNRIVLDKFIKDFVSPTQVLVMTESCAWNGKNATQPLPWAAAHGHLDPQDFHAHAHAANDKWRKFFSGRPDHSYVTIVIRGIDGLSVDPGSWAWLASRYKNLKITLAFTCCERYVRKRNGGKYFSKTEPYDHRLYAFFPLSELVDHMDGKAVHGRIEWLLEEWTQGSQSREQLSMAFVSGDRAHISAAQTANTKLETNGRNGIPYVGPSRY